MRYSALTTAFATLAACLLAGCSSRTDVSLTGNTPVQYSHVWITTQEVWFNTSATAGPDDAGWTKFPLNSPSTVDLVQDTGGTLGTIVNSLRQLPGTYSQIRLIPLDAGAALATSASDLGAIYNAEADFVDSAGTAHQLPLELLNPDQGIGIAGSLHISVATFGSSAALSSGLGTTNTATTTNTTGTGTATAATTTTPTGTTGTTTTTSFAIALDGARDLVPFTFGGTQAGSTTAAYGVLLSSHAAAYNLDNTGGISGTVSLTNLTGVSTTNIQATAETLSADGSRHVAVLSSPVRSDGTFTLFPLPSSTSTAASYDVVIHGAGIATIIIKGVSIPLAASTDTAAGTDTTTADNSTTATTTVAPTTTAATTNIVSIGTLYPRTATAYAAGITTGAGSPLTADAQVGFYQALSASGEVPYQIEASPIDPFNQVLANAVQVSVGTIDSGTYVASGDTIALFSSAPLPGTGGYYVAASAPAFTDGALTPTVSAAAPSVAVPALQVGSGASLAALQAAILPTTPGLYTDGELLVSHNGTLVSRVSLGSVAANGGTVSAPLPSGTSSAKYYVAVRVWNSADLTKVTRQSIPTQVDMSSGGNGAISFAIN